MLTFINTMSFIDNLETDMKKLVILIGIFLIGSLHNDLIGQNESDRVEKNFIDGAIDHIVATLPSKDYELINSFLTEHFSNCWQTQGAKGFIFSASGKPYAELWDAGTFFQFGHQVAFSSEEEDSREKAKNYYGNSGFDLQGVVFTVGKNGQGGDPIGGTFYVEYGNEVTIPVNDSMKIEKLVGIVTSIPVTRKEIINDYRFFNLAVSESDGVYTVKDKGGFTIQLIEEPIENVVFGHMALQFRLKDDLLERKEYALSGSVKAIIDGKDFILVLNSWLYDSYISK